MKITNIKIHLVNKENNKIKAVANLVFEDSLAIHDIRILEGESGLFIAMPSRKNNNGEFKDIVHPINASFREILVKAILEAYNQEISKTKEAE